MTVDGRRRASRCCVERDRVRGLRRAARRASSARSRPACRSRRAQPLDRALAAGEPRVGARRAQGPRLSVRDRATRRRSRLDRSRARRHAAPRSRACWPTSAPSRFRATRASDNRIVRRQLTYRPGQLYQQSKLQESQRRLYSLEIFQFANVEAGHDRTSSPPKCPTSVTVTEGKHRKVNFGVGYGSEEKARAEIDWRHVNFFGGARTVGVLGRYSGLDRGVRLNLTEPTSSAANYSLTLIRSVLAQRRAGVHAGHPGRPRDAHPSFRQSESSGPDRGSGSARRPPSRSGTSTSREDYTISEETLNDPTQRDDLIALGLNPDTGRRAAGDRRC